MSLRFALSFIFFVLGYFLASHGVGDYLRELRNGENFLPLTQKISRLNHLDGLAYEYHLAKNEKLEVYRTPVKYSIFGTWLCHARIHTNIPWLESHQIWTNFDDKLSEKMGGEFISHPRVVYIFGYFSSVHQKIIINFLSDTKQALFRGPYRGEFPINQTYLAAAVVSWLLGLLPWIIL